jgi:cytochrome P450
MPAVAELTLPHFDHTDSALRGSRYREAMAALRGHEGWLAACPFGFIVLDRVSGEFFLRSREAAFPGRTIADLFGITGGPLHEEIVKNIITLTGGDHRRLRNLVNPALAPRAVARYRPAMRAFLDELLDAIPADGRGVRQALPVAGHRRGHGGATVHSPSAAGVVQPHPAPVRSDQPGGRATAHRGRGDRVLRLG